jgi:hypothetical protein
MSAASAATDMRSRQQANGRQNGQKDTRLAVVTWLQKIKVISERLFPCADYSARRVGEAETVRPWRFGDGQGEKERKKKKTNKSFRFPLKNLAWN